MSTYLTPEKKLELFTQFGGIQTNTGGSEAQIALFTSRIEGLSAHLQKNKNDHSCRRSLLTLVGKRKRLLNYLSGKDIGKYRDLIDRLGIRK
ncbi:MAG TPA: 30S ribosomal protein S15 [Saprospiraceae bacterium]|nr:30S ribosomal protein S15 [Saprospiraceae bacterium]